MIYHDCLLLKMINVYEDILDFLCYNREKHLLEKYHILYFFRHTICSGYICYVQKYKEKLYKIYLTICYVFLSCMQVLSFECNHTNTYNTIYTLWIDINDKY